MSISTAQARINGRKGGRPKGTASKPRFSSYITAGEVKSMVAKALDMAVGGDSNMLKFCLEQHFGKAVQPVEGDIDARMSISFDSSFSDATSPDATEHSE